MKLLKVYIEGLGYKSLHIAYTAKEKFEHPLLNWAKGSRLILLITHRRENTGEAMYNIFMAVKDILQQYQDVACNDG